MVVDMEGLEDNTVSVISLNYDTNQENLMKIHYLGGYMVGRPLHCKIDD